MGWLMHRPNVCGRLIKLGVMYSFTVMVVDGFPAVSHPSKSFLLRCVALSPPPLVFFLAVVFFCAERPKRSDQMGCFFFISVGAGPRRCPFGNRIFCTFVLGSGAFSLL